MCVPLLGICVIMYCSERSVDNSEVWTKDAAIGGVSGVVLSHTYSQGQLLSIVLVSTPP